MNTVQAKALARKVRRQVNEKVSEYRQEQIAKDLPPNQFLNRNELSIYTLLLKKNEIERKVSELCKKEGYTYKTYSDSAFLESARSRLLPNSLSYSDEEDLRDDFILEDLGDVSVEDIVEKKFKELVNG